MPRQLRDRRRSSCAIRRESISGGYRSPAREGDKSRSFRPPEGSLVRARTASIDTIAASHRWRLGTLDQVLERVMERRLCDLAPNSALHSEYAAITVVFNWLDTQDALRR
jgi:hypothetical protein